MIVKIIIEDFVKCLDDYDLNKEINRLTTDQVVNTIIVPFATFAIESYKNELNNSRK